jgi:hypothetical protein
MIVYSALTRKACIDPTSVFVIRYWNPVVRKCQYMSFDVGLVKNKGRWVVGEEKLKHAISEKIKATLDTYKMTNEPDIINYPAWYRDYKKT